jgi:hypothetical protein
MRLEVIEYHKRQGAWHSVYLGQEASKVQSGGRLALSLARRRSHQHCSPLSTCRHGEAGAKGGTYKWKCYRCLHASSISHQGARLCLAGEAFPPLASLMCEAFKDDSQLQILAAAGPSSCSLSCTCGYVTSATGCALCPNLAPMLSALCVLLHTQGTASSPQSHPSSPRPFWQRQCPWANSCQPGLLRQLACWEWLTWSPHSQPSARRSLRSAAPLMPAYAPQKSSLTALQNTLAHHPTTSISARSTVKAWLGVSYCSSVDGQGLALVGVWSVPAHHYRLPPPYQLGRNLHS